MMKYLLLHKPHIDCKLLTNIQCFELQIIKKKRLSDYVDIHYLPQTHPIPKLKITVTHQNISQMAPPLPLTINVKNQTLVS